MDTYLAITRVRRQARTESVPVIYKDLKYIIWNNNLGKADSRDWLKALDPQTVASVRKIELSFPSCSADACYFAIFPREVNEPVTEYPDGLYCGDVCPLREDDDKRSEKCK